MDLHACLTESRRYERQIERLHRRYLFTRQLYELQQDNVPLARVIQEPAHLARLLAKTVGRGDYECAPGLVREIHVAGKVRRVQSFRLTDLLVHGVVADIMQEAVSPFLSRQLYSYRKGISWVTAISEFAAYVRRHRKSRPDPRDRGLYVLRRDVASYTDSIPVGPRSPLWQMLREVLEPPGSASTISDADWRLIESVVHPEVRVPGGGVVVLIRGIPTGQPISCVLFNLYLTRLDHALDRIPGGFYARYSDDILFAHPDPGSAKEAEGIIDAGLADLELQANPAKRHDLYLTGAGRASSAWPDTKGTTSIPFLGASVRADGTIALSHAKARGLLRDIHARAMRTARALRGKDPDRAGRLVCSVINRALDPETVFAQPSATLLWRIVTDRRQLAHLDYLIAKIVLRAMTGDCGVRAFRNTPYRRIRNEWGLVSLLHGRNNGATSLHHA